MGTLALLGIMTVAFVAIVKMIASSGEPKRLPTRATTRAPGGAALTRAIEQRGFEVTCERGGPFDDVIAIRTQYQDAGRAAALLEGAGVLPGIIERLEIVGTLDVLGGTLRWRVDERELRAMSAAEHDRNADALVTIVVGLDRRAALAQLPVSDAGAPKLVDDGERDSAGTNEESTSAPSGAPIALHR